MVEKHGLNFDMLSDPENAYAAELGIRFEVPAEVKEIYGGFGIDLPKVNGDDSWTLPIPARLVIDASGVVRAAGAKRVPDDKRAIMGKATADLRESGIMDGVIKVGDTLPPFSLSNADGETVSSADLLAKGPVVLTIFRGHW